MKFYIDMKNYDPRIAFFYYIIIIAVVASVKIVVL